MLNTKFDLYNTEWLDVVFDDRNKAYGAYELRNHYAGRLNKAMAITFSILFAASTAVYIISHNKPKQEWGVIVEYTPPVIPIPPKVEPIKKVEPVKAVQPVKAPTPVATTKYTAFVVTSKPVTEEPPIIDEIKGEVGPANVKGPEGPSLVVEDKGPVGPPAAAKGNGDEIVDVSGLEVNPEPYGGMAAFGKFLGKNMRFPPQAQDAGVSGRVLMSFVIEKNGEISNIHVDREAGYGFDQEAVRVLKLAKAWKPGIQNGQPVRVRYSIPINFQLPAE